MEHILNFDYRKIITSDINDTSKKILRNPKIELSDKEPTFTIPDNFIDVYDINGVSISGGYVDEYGFNLSNNMTVCTDLRLSSSHKTKLGGGSKLRVLVNRSGNDFERSSGTLPNFEVMTSDVKNIPNNLSIPKFPFDFGGRSYHQSNPGCYMLGALMSNDGSYIEPDGEFDFTIPDNVKYVWNSSITSIFPGTYGRNLKSLRVGKNVKFLSMDSQSTSLPKFKELILPYTNKVIIDRANETIKPFRNLPGVTIKVHSSLVTYYKEKFYYPDNVVSL